MGRRTITERERGDVPEVNDVAKLLGLHREIDPTVHEQVIYNGVVAAGDMRDALGDYNRGLYQLKISANVSGELEKEGLGRRYLSFLLTTIDDGCWRAYKPLPREDADRLATEIATKFNDYFGVLLPSEEELNEFLMPFGLWGMRE